MGRRFDSSLAQEILIHVFGYASVHGKSTGSQHGQKLLGSRKTNNRQSNRYSRPHRLVRPRTQGFHPCNTGSNPVGVAILPTCDIVFTDSPTLYSSWKTAPSRTELVFSGFGLGPASDSLFSLDPRQAHENRGKCSLFVSRIRTLPDFGSRQDEQRHARSYIGIITAKTITYVC